MPPAARMPAVAFIMREMFDFCSRAKFDSKNFPGPAEEQKRERELVWCFLPTSNIPTASEARANGAGGMVGECVCNAIVDNKGGAVGVGVEPCQGGGVCVAEFKIASINFWAAFKVFAAAQGATGCPRMRGADRERKQD